MFIMRLDKRELIHNMKANRCQEVGYAAVGGRTFGAGGGCDGPESQVYLRPPGIFVGSPAFLPGNMVSV